MPFEELSDEDKASLIDKLTTFIQARTGPRFMLIVFDGEQTHYASQINALDAVIALREVAKGIEKTIAESN